MAKKKSLLSSFLSLVFGLLKWLVVGIWEVLKFFYHLAVKAVELGKKAKAEGSRPNKEAEHSPLAEVERSEGSLPEFESFLYSGKSAIGLILGSRGSGKSTLGMRVLENVSAKTGRKTCCIGFDRKSLPKWVVPVDSTASVPNGSFLLVDEGGVEFSSRSSMSGANKLLSELLLISRHKGIAVLFISQNSSNIEVNAIRQSDYLLLKPPSLLQLDFERKAIRDIYEGAKEGFQRHSAEKGLLYVYSDRFRGFASNNLPSFWSENLSKSYKDKK